MRNRIVEYSVSRLRSVMSKPSGFPMASLRICCLVFMGFFTDQVQSQTTESPPSNDIIITSGGSTFAEDIYPAWFKAYKTEFNSPEVLSYEPTGSTIGVSWIEGLMQPRSLYPFPIVFAGSDSPLPSSDYQKFPELQMFPSVSGYGILFPVLCCALHDDVNNVPCFSAIVLVFNLPGISSLNLSREAIIDIFSGNITVWNDRILAELNPETILPNKTIQPIVRRDGSGSSEVFTRGLSAFSHQWTFGVIKDPKLLSPEGPSSVWPSADRFFGMGNAGINGLVSSIPYSISYAAVSGAVAGNLNIATIRNKAGKYIPPTDISHGVRAAMDYYAGQMDDRLTVFLVDAPVDDAYPFATYTYMILNMTTHPQISCEQVKLLVQVLQWTHTSALAEQLASQLDLVALSTQMAAIVENKVFKNITCEGRNVLEWIAADAAALVASKQFPTLKVVGGAATCLVGIIVLLLVAYQYRRRKVMTKDWLIPASAVEKQDQAWRSMSPRASSVLTTSTSVSGLSEAFCSDDSFPAYKGFTAYVQDASVLCFEAIVYKQPAKFKFKTSSRLSTLCRQMNHRNVGKLLGIVAHHDGVKYWFDDGIYHLYEDPGKTTLHGMLATSPYRLNQGVMVALALDVCHGMRFLAKKGIVHGQLNTFNCILDNNWTVRICNWSQTAVAQYEHLADNEISDGTVKRNALFMTRNDEALKRLLYIHPDILRGKVKLTDVTYEHDLYSFAMVLGEIFTRELPYAEVGTMIGWKSTLLAILDGQNFPSCKPTIPQTVFDLVKRLANAKWSEGVGANSYDASLQILNNVAKPVGTGKKPTGIVDSLLSEMELYVVKLEAKMEDRAAGLKELNHRTKFILNSFIPVNIATTLQAGRQPEPEQYKNATVCYVRYTFIGRKMDTSDVAAAEEYTKLFDVFENTAITSPLGIKIITITDNTVLLMSGHDGKASNHVEAALSMLKFSLIIANNMRGRSTQLNIGISSGPVSGVLAGTQGQRFIVFGNAVDCAKELSTSSPSSTVRLSSTTYGLVRAFLHQNKIDIVPQIHGNFESYLASFS